MAVEHLSGLAARDAARPEVMTAGFLALGAATWPFASAMEDALGGPARAGRTPTVLRVAAAAIVATGLLRRDRTVLGPPEEPFARSWHDHGHEVASAVAYAAAVSAPAAFAWRVRREPACGHLSGPAWAVTAAVSTLLGVFASRVVEPWNGYVQRAAVTVSSAGTAALAVALCRRPPPWV